MSARVPDHAYLEPSSNDRDREIDNVVLPIIIVFGTVLLGLNFLGWW